MKEIRRNIALTAIAVFETDARAPFLFSVGDVVVRPCVEVPMRPSSVYRLKRCQGRIGWKRPSDQDGPRLPNSTRLRTGNQQLEFPQSTPDP